MIASAVLTAASAVLAIPTAFVSAECMLGVLAPGQQRAWQRAPGTRAVVLVPAHDEEQGLGATLAGVFAQLGSGDRVLVVADNCSDRTAEVARAAGADVVERFDTSQRGKGYAITFGMAELAKAPPDVVVIVDADCQLGPGAIDLLVAAALETGRPSQADYTLNCASASDLRARVSVFAFRVRNRVRPLGLARLGGGCHLAGTGMAFPWAVLASAMPLGADLAEDLALGIDLSLKGHFPLFVAAARVESELAATAGGQASQRTRWEQGHLATLRRALPPLLAGAIRQRSLRALETALDVSVPPLVLHVLLLGSAAAGAVVLLSVGGSSIPLALTGAQLALLTTALGAAWVRHGRDVLPPATLVGVPLYVLWKVPMYVRMLVFGGAKSWVRAERSTTPRPTNGAAAHAHGARP